NRDHEPGSRRREEALTNAARVDIPRVPTGFVARQESARRSLRDYDNPEVNRDHEPGSRRREEALTNATCVDIPRVPTGFVARQETARRSLRDF
ncbi:MAG TPA: hypothetical protein PLX89_01620, partial [Verrucomicrobiota bacterium]|nr:hypothetical protein [Verrucomicrobiota bacterium]